MAHDAAENGDLEQLKTFGDVSDILNDHKENVMHTAVRFGHLSIVDYLSDRYPQLSIGTNNKGQIPLHVAVEKRQLSIIEKLVCFSTELVVIRDNEGYSPLRYALFMGVWQAVVLMLSYQPSITFQTMLYGQTLLHDAVYSNDVTTMRYLLTICPLPLLKYKNFLGVTPLHLAVEQGFLAMVQLIVERDPTTVDVQDKNECTPIFFVNNLTVLTFFYEQYPHTLQKKLTHLSSNLLHHICRFSSTIDPEVMDSLLRMCPSLLCESTTDDTPLHIAFRRKHKVQVNTILRFKPDFHVIDKYSANTSLHMAIKMCCDLDVVLAVFQSRPSNIDCVNVDGETPLDVAINAKNRAVVEMFQPHMTVDMVVAVSDMCLKNCGIDLLAYAMQQCANLNDSILPDISSLVFEFLGISKKNTQT